MNGYGSSIKAIRKVSTHLTEEPYYILFIHRIISKKIREIL